MLPRPRPARMARSYIFYDSMDLDPTDEQRSIIDVFGALADRTCPVDRLREHEPLGFSPDLWAQLVAVGAPGMAVPEDAGGAGAALLDLSLAVEALGRRLAPAPLVEHAVTARLLARADALPADVLDGERPATLALRPAADHMARLVPAGAVAGLVVALDGDDLVAVVSPPGDLVPNLASAPLADRAVAPDAVEVRTVLASGSEARELHAHAVDEWRVLTAAALAGLGLGALAIAITYVTEREQFGVPIGSFQSIQHGLADVAVALDGAQLLGAQGGMGVRCRARRRGAARRDGVPLLRGARPARRRTCAALPRRLRLHGGVRHPALLPTGQGVGERARRARPRVRRVSPTCGTARSSRRWPEWTSPRLPAAVQFGNEVRDLISAEFTDEVRQRAHDTGTMHDWGLHRAIAAQGWIEQALPEALGGGGRGPEELAVLFRELELAGVPYDGLSICTMLASVIAHVGNEMQRQVVLPKLLAGESLIALGYSEPDSGSDVAAARTRAVRDGDGWRIDGQKIFTSLAEESEWVFLLTRTDPDVAKHQGLTFFLVPTSAPGFEVQPIRTLSGKRTNTTFYDGVYVDDEWRVGEVNGGWQVMLVALSFERGVVGGVRDAERLLMVAEEHVRTAKRDDGSSPLADPDLRRDLTRLAIDCEVTDLLAVARGLGGRDGRAPGGRGGGHEAVRHRGTGPRDEPPARRLRSGGPGAVARRHRPLRPSTSTTTASHRSRPSTAGPARSSATSSPNAGSACRARAEGRDQVRALPGLRVSTRARRVSCDGPGVPGRRDGPEPYGRSRGPPRSHRLGRRVRTLDPARRRRRRHPGREPARGVRRRRPAHELAGGGRVRGRVPRCAAHRHRGRVGRTDRRRVRRRHPTG